MVDGFVLARVHNLFLSFCILYLICWSNCVHGLCVFFICWVTRVSVIPQVSPEIWPSGSLKWTQESEMGWDKGNKRNELEINRGKHLKWNNSHALYEISKARGLFVKYIEDTRVKYWNLATVSYNIKVVYLYFISPYSCKDHEFASPTDTKTKMALPPKFHPSVYALINAKLANTSRGYIARAAYGRDIGLKDEANQ